MQRNISALFYLACVFAAAGVQAQEINPAQSEVSLEVDPARFESAIKSFETWDSKNTFPADANLFLGSSSVRRWATAKAFPDKVIINRGFGGSHMSDVNFYFDNVVKPYDAPSIFIYAGDNDIGGGKSAERVLADFATFVALVEEESRKTQIHFLSIKPSKDRWEFWAEMDRANQLIKNLAETKSNVTYVDVASMLLDRAGQPKDVFVGDGLHLNWRGYRLWTEAVSPYLK